MNLPHASQYLKTDAGQVKRLEAEVLGLHAALASLVAHIGNFKENEINKIQISLDPAKLIKSHSTDGLDQAHALSSYSQVFTDAREIAKSK